MEISITKYLNSLHAALKEFDTSSKERKEADQTARQSNYFPKREDWACAICGRRQSPPSSLIELAHIVPVADGGKPEEDNLIPLCNGSIDPSQAMKCIADSFFQLYPNASSEDVERMESMTLENAMLAFATLDPLLLGCHRLYDSGLIPREKIRQLRAKKLGPKPISLREDALRVNLSSLNLPYSPTIEKRVFLSNAWDDFRRAACNVDGLDPEITRKLRELRNRLTVSILRRNHNLLQAALNRTILIPDGGNILRKLWEALHGIVSRARRSAALPVFRIAEALFSVLDQFVLSQHGLPDRLLSLHHYEGALLLMSRFPNPDVEGSITRLEESRNFGEDGRTLSELVHAKTIRSSPLEVESSFAALHNELKRAKERIPKDKKTPQWKLNHLIHLAQLQFKAGKLTKARRACARAWKIRDSLALGQGWTPMQAIYLNLIDVSIDAHRARSEEDYLRCLDRLDRCLKLMKSAKAKRPEGFEDLARCAAYCIDRLGLDIKINILPDGRSSFWRTPE